MNKFLQLLKSDETIILDGAMGTMLIASGINTGEAPELWNETHPEKIAEIHHAYIEAGARVIVTNSFGGTSIRLKRYKLDDRIYDLNFKAAHIAREEADRWDNNIVVAGSIGPLGELIKPLGKIEFEEAKTAFKDQAKALADGGIDVFWIETMSDLNEIKAAIEGIREVSDLPISVTMSFDTHGRTVMGVTPAKAVNYLLQFPVSSIGANCGNGPSELISAIQQMHETNPEIILVAKANAGLPKMVNQKIVYDGTPDIMGDYALHVKEAGAKFIGACCGSTPAHIKVMSDTLQK
jgi:5-methyltetrahydrofolate--homocysteine methyltransferase